MFLSNILGFFGSGKTWLASEVVKIKVAQQHFAKNEVQIHAFVFHDKLNQLKADINKKWLCDVKMTNITDIKKFIGKFSNQYQLKPEHQNQLEEYRESSEDFKLTLQSIASRMDQSGKTHIIIIEEVDLKNVTSQEAIKGNNLEVDLGYLSEYQNIHFIFCLRPAKEGLNNFTISFPTLQSNQYFVCLGMTYRNTHSIQRLIKNVQSQISTKSEGYSLMGDIPINEMLPPPLIPSGYNSSVIWVPVIPSVEDEALEEIYSLLLFEELDELQGEEYPSVAILYSNDSLKTLARKLKQKNTLWYGPLKDVNYHGGEADVVIFISDGHLNVQTLARARRLLILITLEKEWDNSKNPSLNLNKAIVLDMIEILRLGDCPYEIITCEACQSKFDKKLINYHLLEECQSQVKCQNHEKGCEWKGLTRSKKNHIIDDCLYEESKCRFCKGIRHRKDIVRHESYHLKRALLIFNVIIITITIIIIYNISER